MSEEKFAKKIISALNEVPVEPLNSNIEARLALARENALKVARNSRQIDVMVQSNGSISLLSYRKIITGFMLCIVLIITMIYSHLLNNDSYDFDVDAALNAIESDYSDALQLPEEE